MGFEYQAFGFDALRAAYFLATCMGLLQAVEKVVWIVCCFLAAQKITCRHNADMEMQRQSRCST